MDYTIYYKRKFDSTDDITADYDLFISAYNSSSRVNEVFEKINSKEKHWLIFSEYNYEGVEIPKETENVKSFQYASAGNEGEFIRQYYEQNNERIVGKICVDITGFLRPHLVFFIRYLKHVYKGSIDFLYSDPESYKDKEETSFTSNFTEVNQISGCEGIHNPETHNDILIIGSGYDDKRISDVAKSKAEAKKVQLFGFPSLQPDMFQQNILSAYKAEEESMTAGDSFVHSNSTMYAPANDPFVTAQTLSDFVKKESRNKEIGNLYLCPLSTKAQTLGFALFYVTECLDKPVSMIFPYCGSYERETTVGISKVWIYTLEFPED